MVFLRYAKCSSLIGERGSRSRPESIPSIFIAAFTGIGFVSTKRAEKSFAYFAYSSVASLKLPPRHS